MQLLDVEFQMRLYLENSPETESGGKEGYEAMWGCTASCSGGRDRSACAPFMVEDYSFLKAREGQMGYKREGGLKWRWGEGGRHLLSAESQHATVLICLH